MENHIPGDDDFVVLEVKKFVGFLTSWIANKDTGKGSFCQLVFVWICVCGIS